MSFANNGVAGRLYIMLVIGTLFLLAGKAWGKPVRYEIVATQGNVNLSGKKEVDFALMLNGKIPAPTLEFTEGDDAEIVVKNNIPGREVSVHWHGILLPPEMDGVPYVTTPPIASGGSYTFKFKLRQNGTYWYHSHTDVQEQKGIYGAIVIHPKTKAITYDRDLVVVLSDWSDENATSILANLRKDGDYYLYKKGSMRSWLGAIQAKSLGNYLSNEWTRMGGMDLSDVGYDAFLINGKPDLQLLEAHPGEKIRIRVINAAASSYFYLSLGDQPMKVISADGIDIDPANANEILIGMAETYDVLFEVPNHKNYEFKATAQDGTGSASGWIGMGEKVNAPIRPPPDAYAAMEHGSGSHEGHEAPSQDMTTHEGHGSMKKTDTVPDEHKGHVMNPGTAHPPEKKEIGRVIQTLTVDTLKSKQRTKFPSAPTRDLKLVLDGDMSRYVWHINGKAIFEDRTILIKEGEVVRFTFVNYSMMHHPMHLHGHFFRVINDGGDHSPLKHTVDVPPHGTRIIEFLADEPGEWMLHCHNLYHLKTGMARVVKYETFEPTPEIKKHQKHDPHNHDHIYFYGMAEAATNHAQANFRLSQTWQQLEARVETRNSAGTNFSFNEEWEIEGDLFYRRWVNRFFSIVGGATYFNESPRVTIGFSYMLPFLIETQALIDHRGQFRFDLEKRFQWTRTLFTDVDLSWRPGQRGTVETPFEYEISLMFSPEWSWAVGLMLTDHAIGAGAQFQF